MGFPKMRGTLLGVPIIRTIVFWDLYWGPRILGNCPLWTGLKIHSFFPCLPEKSCWVAPCDDKRLPFTSIVYKASMNSFGSPCHSEGVEGHRGSCRFRVSGAPHVLICDQASGREQWNLQLSMVSLPNCVSTTRLAAINGKTQHQVQGALRYVTSCIWGIVKMMVPFWVP